LGLETDLQKDSSNKDISKKGDKKRAILDEVDFDKKSEISNTRTVR
jgi:hypothetical protein